MQAVAVLSYGDIEPYMPKKNKKGESAQVSYWTSVIRSLVWKEEGGVQNIDFIFDPDGIAQTVINCAVQYEQDQFKAATRPQFCKELSLAIKKLLFSLKRMKVANMWLTIAKNVKACFIETRLAQLRAYEVLVNEEQNLRIIDSFNSDVV